MDVHSLYLGFWSFDALPFGGVNKLCTIHFSHDEYKLCVLAFL